MRKDKGKKRVPKYFMKQRGEVYHIIARIDKIFVESRCGLRSYLDTMFDAPQGKRLCKICAGQK